MGAELARIRPRKYAWDLGQAVKNTMPLKPASSDLSDTEFLAEFCACSLPPACFRHADHLRLAWLYVHQQHSLKTAIDKVRDGIRAYATHLGRPELYHETITVAWVHLIASHDEPTFEEFLRMNEHRLNGELLHRFWSPELLRSETAGREWVAPDRMRLPALASGTK
jgi:hypothetical protein